MARLLSPARPAAFRVPIWAGLGLLTVAALLLRGLALSWQPLWWDEGYSVFFATEGLGEMARLTARDIHPPLYYALLHLWIDLWGGAHPLALRSLSVLIGGLGVPALWWTARTLFPAQPPIAWLAALLLALNPMHLFYSQEVRMYGLELLLGLISTGLFWRLWQRRDGPLAWGRILAYAVACTLLLYTEYYAALLPVAHFLWAGAQARSRPRSLLPLALAAGMVALLYLPWVIFSLPHLFAYIQAKVVADNDAPLGLLAYVGRHLLAFAAGHLPVTGLDLLRYLGALGLAAALLGGWALAVSAPPREERQPSFLAWGLLLPAAVGYLLNRLWPFFPVGGERVLFFLLPGALILAAWGVAEMARRGRTGRAGAAVALLCLLIGAGSGVATFYTTPRYQDDDYRPLIRQVVQQGTDQDTVLAVFPWQVGFWRAYAPVFTPLADPVSGGAATHGPWPRLLSFDPVAWGPEVAQAVDAGLASGALWLPSLLSIGSTLPQEMEAYLAQNAVNLENRWISPTTRLSAWIPARPNPLQPLAADFGPVALIAAGVLPPVAPSANSPLQIDLAWAEGSALENIQATLRLVDAGGQTWSQRTLTDLDGLTRAGLLVPAGLPPGPYTVQLGVMAPSASAQSGAPPDLLPVDGGEQSLVTLGHVTVSPPAQPVPSLRLPIQQPLAAPAPHLGAWLLGFSLGQPDQPHLAGAPLDLTLFWQQGPAPGLATPTLAVSLVDRAGAPVAGWEGGALTLAAGQLAQIPIRLDLPGFLAAGSYGLAVGLAGDDGTRTPATRLGQVEVVRRDARLEPTSPQIRLDPPVQFGTHVRLLGYDLDPQPPDPERPHRRTLVVTLHWQVVQPLLPPHLLFLHGEDERGQRVAQEDGPLTHVGSPAPSGAWQPGEFLLDPRRLDLPAGEEISLGLGFYLPASGVRLPATQGDQPLGDTFRLILAP